MKISRKTYIFIIFFALFFILWIIKFDCLLLSMWLGILLVILISYVISYFSLTGITVERFTWIKNQVVGNSFEERIEIKNNSKTPKL